MATVSFSVPSFFSYMQPVTQPTAQGKVDFVNPANIAGWLDAMIQSDDAVERLRKSAAKTGEAARNIKTRFCIWAVDQCKAEAWWETSQGKKFLAAYAEKLGAVHAQKKAAGLLPKSSEFKASVVKAQLVNRHAIPHYNTCEETRAKEQGRDPVLMMTAEDKRRAELGPVGVVRLEVAKVYVRLAKREETTEDAQALLEKLKEVAGQQAIAQIEAASAPKAKAKTTTPDDGEGDPVNPKQKKTPPKVKTL